MPSKSKRHDKTITKSTKIEPAAPPPSISWPALTPLRPVQDLSLHHLIPHQLCTVSNLLTPTLCKHYVAHLSSLPLITTPAQAKRGHALRVNDRLQVHDPAFARRLWEQTALHHLIGGLQDEQQEQWGGSVLGLNPNVRVYRYTRGQFFAQHYDDSNAVVLNVATEADGSSRSVKAKTTWTLLIYLSCAATGCVGGQTVFYPPDDAASRAGKGSKGAREQEQGPVVVELETGMALLHRHGNECMLHEGKEVTEGEKWVIRSDLCVAA